MTTKFGQHFLINQSAIQKIIVALNLQPNDTIIEIGPGKGALTFPLAAECQKIGCRIIGIEKDKNLIEILRDSIKIDGNSIEIINGDALKEIPKIIKPYNLKPITYKIVGNIPYYITGKLLRILSEIENKPELTVLMLQKEVAERIAANPPKMNLLAAAVQFWAESKILFKLEPHDFNPPPEVESAVIKLTANNKQPTTNFTTKYYKLIRIIFKQPRKTLLNNLKNGLKISKLEIILKKLGLNPEIRPQNLSLDQIKNLAVFFK